MPAHYATVPTVSHEKYSVFSPKKRESNNAHKSSAACRVVVTHGLRSVAALGDLAGLSERDERLEKFFDARDVGASEGCSDLLGRREYFIRRDFERNYELLHP